MAIFKLITCYHSLPTYASLSDIFVCTQINALYQFSRTSLPLVYLLTLSQKLQTRLYVVPFVEDYA